MSFEQAMRIPVKLLLPLLGELLRHDVNVDQVLNCPGGRLPLEALLNGDVAALDRPDFIHAYGLCTRLLVQTICRQEARTDTLDRMIKPFLAFVITGNTLREACQRANEFNIILEEHGFSHRLEISDDTAHFIIDLKPAVLDPPLALISSNMLMFFNVFSWLTGAAIDMEYLGVSQAQSAEIDPYLEAIGCPIKYELGHNVLAFRKDNLSRKISKSGSDINDAADCLAYDPILFIRPNILMSDRVEEIFQEIARNGDRLPDSLCVAQKLGISQSTLSRRLKEENTAFLTLKSKCQVATAKTLLGEGEVRLPQIATRLGFVDVRSFRRAFLNWTGMLPSTFRAQYRSSAFPKSN